MFSRLFPRRIDNTYSGRRLGLWLLIPVLILELVIGGNSMIDPRRVAATADGIPLASYDAAAAAQVVALFALLGFCRLLLALQGVVALVRYRSAIPLVYLTFLTLQLGNRVLDLAHPTASSAAPSTGLGSAVVVGLAALLLAGLILSVWPAPSKRGGEIPDPAL